MMRRHGKGKGGGKGKGAGTFPTSSWGQGAFASGPGAPGGGSRQTYDSRWTGGRSGDGPGKGGGSPLKCVNCGSDQHAASACPKPRVPANQRPCSGCGEAGHPRSQCPKGKGGGKGGGGGRALKAVDEPDAPIAFFGCVGCEEEFVQATRTFRPKPTPRGATFGDYVPLTTSNKYDDLADETLSDDSETISSSSWGCGRSAPGPRAPMTVRQIRRMAAKKKRNANENEPNALNSAEDDFNCIMAPFMEQLEEEEPIFAATEIIETSVAMDSGAVAHGASAKDIPETVEVMKKGPLRNFVGANNSPIEHFGTAAVRLEQEDGQEVDNNFEVVDVVRPLHSVSMTCDNRHNVLFNKDAGYVVPEGIVERILATLSAEGVRPAATYKRRGGLYVAKVKVKDPRAEGAGRRSESGFTRPGQGR